MKICMGCMGQYRDEYNICPHCGFFEGTRAAEAMHMDPGSILSDRYIIGKVVGFGGFGVTYIGWDAKLERKIAVKEYLPGEFSTRVPGRTQITVFSDSTKVDQFNTGMKKFIDEARSLARFQAEDGVVKVYDTFEENNTAYIVMEFLEGETLTEYLKRENTIPYDKSIEMLLPIVRSLQTIHASGIIHRDIAPDNIHIGTNGKIKLIDFGAARYATTNHSRSLTVIIKPGYSPEEQYRSRGDQGPHTDVYAIGAVLYRMITGVTPPDAMERRAMFEKYGKDMLAPVEKLAKDVPANRTAAIANSLNVRIENRTADMSELENELTTEGEVARREGRIGKIDILKAPLPVKIGIGAAAAAVCTLSVLFVTGVIGFDALLQTSMSIPEGMTRVPSIVNNELAEAEGRVSEYQLLYAVAGKEYSTRIPEGRVLSQDTTAGSVVPVNSLVSIEISGGVETKAVDEFSGEDVDSVRLELEAKGFNVKIVQEYSNEFAAGAVIAQDAKAGAELAVGETITLRVSMGQNPDEAVERVAATVPDLVGMSSDDARDTLIKSGFVFKIERREYSDTVPESEVISQSVAYGAGGMTGDTIEVVVSRGAFVAYMPDVQYKHIDDAKYLLQDQQLKYTISYQESETVRADHVISQDITAKTKLSAGATVKLVVSRGGKSVSVPDAASGSPKLQDARNTLTAAGFSVTVSYEKSDTVEEGRVIRQSIASGTAARRGESITLIVSSGKDKQTTVLPNVAGLPQADAKSTLEALGFKVSVSELESESVAQGLVITQSPASGTEQMNGSSIYLTVSKGEPAAVVPDVRGMSQSMAEKTLQEAKLMSTVNTEFSKEEDKDKVTAQNPRAGANAKRGDVVTITVSLGAKTDQMPNVIGQTQSIAENSINALKLSLVISVTQEFSDTIPEGSVVSQTPWAGVSVKDGANVQLVVSKGGNPVDIPNIVGLAESSARSQIQDKGLRVGTVTQEYSNTVELGKVISQSPNAGTPAKKGDTVNLAVSKGAELLDVPNLSGYQLADAKSKNTNFKIVEGTPVFSDTMAAGFIISQNPSAGSKAAKDATITVVVSKGKEPVEVPDVVGMAQSAAESAIRSRGFAVTVETGTSMTAAAGTVISQVPAGKISAPKGDTVRIIVSVGKPKVTVPDVVGKTRENARASIEGVLLAVEFPTANHDTIPAGTVISQTPAAGASVDQGSKISVTVSAGKAEFDVPNVVGKTWEAAKGELEGNPYSFKTSKTEEFHDSVTAGNVIETSPSAGSMTQKGATISVVVSKGKKPIPSVLNMTEANARSTLEAAGFTVDVNYRDTKQYHDSLTNGEVINVWPVDNQSNVDTNYTSKKVTIRVPRDISQGKEPFPAYVKGANQATGVGGGLFTFNVIEQYSDTVTTVGDVISQNPPANSSNWSSRTAEVIVSKGKAKFPAYTGSDSAVGEDGSTFTFNVTRQYSNSYGKDMMISQNPGAGDTSWTRRDANVIVSLGKPIVPHVVGNTENTARGTITGLGNGSDLRVDTSRAYSDSVPAGNVISQSPESGIEVNTGSLITLVISDGPQLPSITEVTVTQDGSSVEVNSTVYFNVVVSGTNVPQPPSVTWEIISTGHASGTSIDPYSGVLTISAEETSSEIKVRATSTLDTSKSGVGTVYIPNPYSGA